MLAITVRTFYAVADRVLLQFTQSLHRRMQYIKNRLALLLIVGKRSLRRLRFARHRLSAFMSSVANSVG